MTESEAIEKLKNIRLFMQIEDEKNECKFAEDDYKANEMAIQALEEVQQYREIGTLEECRTAREKQIPMKPIMKQYFKDMEEKYLCCPTCGEILTDRIPGDNKTFCFHCMNCGQKLDWSDEK